MSHTLSFSPLSLDLPSSRMSVDFTKFNTSQLPVPNSSLNKPHPKLPTHNTIPRRPVARPIALSDVKEEAEPARNIPSQQSSRKWTWSRPSKQSSDSRIVPLSRANSSASSISSASTAISTAASTASTAASSIFSKGQTTLTARTSHSSLQYSTASDPFHEEKLNLSSLPLSLLEHILSYALCLPLTVSIGPQNSENRHMQYRYHRAGLDYIDIQLILKHPLFMVSHYMREVALDVFRRKCDFVIDLHTVYHTKVSSTINDNMKKQLKFWSNEPPKMVRDTLRNLSRLHLRLPTPSCENGGHRGRDEENWMDGSDGKGGGGWKIKSIKKEQEDAAGIQKCLEAIMELVKGDKEYERESRSRSRSLTRSNSLRRTLSRARSRSRSRGRQTPSRNQSRQSTDEDDAKRQPLKRIDIVLVKRGPYVMVLPETLGLIRVLRSVPVTGFTRYYFELETQKVLWATKYRKRWQGFEPDGPRLLKDLQGLTVADRPIEPIRTPTEFKFVNVNKGGKLQLSAAAIPKTPIILERPNTAERGVPDFPPPSNQSNILRNPMTWARKKSHKRKDSFALMMEEGMDEIGSSGTTTSGRNHPPTVDELKKIAEDIKNGLY